MEPIRAHSDDAAFWIALSQIKRLNNANLCQLLTRLGSPESIFNASISQLKEVVSAEIASMIKQGLYTGAIQPALDWLQKDNTHLVTLADKTYPQSLLQISNPPAILFGIGHLRWLNHRSIAMVGVRHATPQGKSNEENLCTHTLCLVSGMALGIDGAAHRGVLKSNGATIAVVGTGLDIVYPAKDRNLAQKIAEPGIILSEFPLGTPSKAKNFPRRNMLISGLSLGCLVVEANIDSGSIIMRVYPLNRAVKFLLS